MADETQQQSHEEPKEEFFENEATDVEVEDVGEATAETTPWDPSKIRISTKSFSLRQVVDMIRQGDLELAPDFQRLFARKPVQRSRLVESILLGIPLPAFYFSQDAAGVMQVVDGVQRLTAIYRFSRDEEALSDLEYLTNLEGKTFANLDVALQRRFHQTQIFVNVIEPQTPDEIKFDVFMRINTGSSPLTAQEIRHCISRGRSRELLKALVALPSFHEATDGAFRDERRMADRELALRFCAFRSLPKIDDYGAFTSLDGFLLDFIRRIDGTHLTEPEIPESELERLQTDFDRAMRSAITVFGHIAFRKYPTWAKRRGPINRALFESWAVALADYEPERLAPHASKIVEAARTAMEDVDYNASISQGTGNFSKVVFRFAFASETLRAATQ